MKVALIINDEMGVAFCEYLHELGADVVAFCEVQEFAVGLQDISYKLIPTLPLWIQKKCQSVDYALTHHERMKDSFRVNYRKKSSVEKSSFSPQFSQYLEDEFDIYEDVDGVVNISRDLQSPHFSHPSFAPALGELKFSEQLIKNNKLCYMPKREDVVLPEEGEIALIGTTELSNCTIAPYLEWITQNGQNEKKTRRMFWITHESNPWNYIDSKLREHYFPKIKNLFDSKIETFLKEKSQWDQLEDYMKVKVKKPLCPIPDLVIFAGHVLHSFDVLINSDEVFLTLESLGADRSSIQNENSQQEIKTVSARKVFVHHGLKNNSPFTAYLRNDEPGIFFYDPKYWSKESMMVDFEKKFTSYFRRS